MRLASGQNWTHGRAARCWRCRVVPDGVADVDAAFTVLGYPAAATKGADAAGQARTVALPAPAKAAVLPAGAPGVSVIGAGNCSSRR